MAQKAYMQKCIFMGNHNPEIFKDWLLEMNDTLEYFPTWADPGPGTVPPCKLEEVDGSRKIEWHLTMVAQGHDHPELFASVEEACMYYKQLYEADKLK